MARGRSRLVPLQPTGFPDEATLHALVAREPQLLPLSGAPQIAVLGQEVALGEGSADILAVEDSGRLVVMEVKLAVNAEARRAVVAQALAYASYLDRLSMPELESTVLGRHLRSAGHETVIEAVVSQDQEGAFDAATFGDGLADSLAHGRFRVVLVLDRAPSELIRLVGYLERVSGELTIDLVTVAAYDVGGSRVIVPQRIDPEGSLADHGGARRPAPQGELTSGADAFERSLDNDPPDQELLRRLVSWARNLEAEGLARLYSFRGVSGRMTLLPRLPGEEVGLVTAWNDGGASLSFWRSVFERRAPQTLTRVEERTGRQMGQGTGTSEIDDPLLAALDDAYREAAGRS